MHSWTKVALVATRAHARARHAQHREAVRPAPSLSPSRRGAEALDIGERDLPASGARGGQSLGSSVSKSWRRGISATGSGTGRLSEGIGDHSKQGALPRPRRHCGRDLGSVRASALRLRKAEAAEPSPLTSIRPAIVRRASERRHLGGDRVKSAENGCPTSLAVEAGVSRLACVVLAAGKGTRMRSACRRSSIRSPGGRWWSTSWPAPARLRPRARCW